MADRIAQLVLAGLLATISAGCVERKLAVTSEPPGAILYLSGEEVGRTPWTGQFTWYGDYDVVLRREGCQTLKTHYNVQAPLYDLPPIDLLSELAPWTYHVERSAHFQLAPQTQPANPELLQRAEEMRQRTNR